MYFEVFAKIKYNPRLPIIFDKLSNIEFIFKNMLKI